MMRSSVWFVAGAAAAFVAIWLVDFRTQSVPETAASQSLGHSLEGLSDQIREAGEFVREHHWYGSEQEQAEAYRHIARQLTSALEGYALMDADFPYFRELNTRTKSGMDNSDQRYLIASLRGEAVYRVWGSRGSSRRLDFSVYGYDELAASISTLETDQLVIDENGDFEVIVGGPPRAGNWLASAPGTLRLLVRQIHSDWPNEIPGDIHIDRIDEARPRYPEFTPAIMSARLDAAAAAFAQSVRRWPEMSRTRFAKLMPVNTLTPPRDTGTEGGLSGRLMVGGHFELADNEALIVTTWPSSARYQGIQLGHHWWESLDYANRQTSLTTDQAQLSSDGAYHFVISARDPGVPNWLDTEGFTRGVILLRYDGMEQPELPNEQYPVAKLVSFDEVRDSLPADEPRVSPAERDTAIGLRRKHVQQRFGY
jgi:hypothetical protein